MVELSNDFERADEMTKRQKAYKRLRELGYEYGDIGHTHAWRLSSEGADRKFAEEHDFRQSASQSGEYAFAEKVMGALGLRRKYAKLAKKLEKERGHYTGPVTLFIEDIKRAEQADGLLASLERVAYIEVGEL